MLWNASALNCYLIKAFDGPLGTVAGLTFDGADWAITSLVVAVVTGHDDDSRAEIRAAAALPWM